MRRRLTFTVLAAGVLLAGAGVPAGAQTDRLEYLKQGKTAFERSCGICHGLERPLSKTFGRAEWEATVERMHDHGAEATKAEREQIVAYLLTKNVFEAKCSLCHGTDRPLGASKSAADWLTTVQRMAGKKPGHLAAGEIADIAAYLALVRPLQ